MDKKAVRIPHDQWASSTDFWSGRVEGKEFGTDITILFYATDEVGKGPVWHVHTYDEVFIIRKGRALFTIGKDKIVAEEGDIVFGPAEIPHKFENLGPDRLESTDIHLSRSWVQTDLPDPEL